MLTFSCNLKWKYSGAIIISQRKGNISFAFSRPTFPLSDLLKSKPILGGGGGVPKKWALLFALLCWGKNRKCSFASFMILHAWFQYMPPVYPIKQLALLLKRHHSSANAWLAKANKVLGGTSSEKKRLSGLFLLNYLCWGFWSPLVAQKSMWFIETGKPCREKSCEIILYLTLSLLLLFILYPGRTLTNYPTKC